MLAQLSQTRVTVFKLRSLLFELCWGFKNVVHTEFGGAGWERERQSPAQKHNSFVSGSKSSTVNANHTSYTPDLPIPPANEAFL